MTHDESQEGKEMSTSPLDVEANGHADAIAPGQRWALPGPKSDDLMTHLVARIDEMGERLDGRIDEMGKRLDGRIDEMGERLGGRIDNLALQVQKLADVVGDLVSWKQRIWGICLAVSGFASITGLLWALVKTIIQPA
jgi:hypothetical protein